MLVESSGLANEVWTVETRSLTSVRETRSRLRASSWSSAIDYQGLWKSAALPFLGGVKRRVGFSADTIREWGVPLLYTERVEVTSKHICEQNGELSLRAGANKSADLFQIAVPAEAAAAISTALLEKGITRYVVLSPGGGWLSKCWPPDRFGSLCEQIYNHFAIRCVVNYGPGEENIAAAVRAAAGDANPHPYFGTLGELMALLQNALCVVAGDSGPLHLAAALGTRTVSLFGPTDPERNGPYPPERSIVLRSPRAVTTYKRGGEPDRSMFDLDVDAVFAAVSEQLHGALAA